MSQCLSRYTLLPKCLPKKLMKKGGGSLYDKLSDMKSKNKWVIIVTFYIVNITIDNAICCFT